MQMLKPRVRMPAMAALVAAAALLIVAGPFPGTARAMAVRPRVNLDMGNASQGQLRFYAQSACYRGQNGRQRLQLTYAVGFDQLQFLRDSAGYRSGFTFSVIADDRGGNQVAGDSWERTITTGDFPLTQRRDSIATGSLVLALAPGAYRLTVACSDANSQRSGRLESEIVIPALAEACALSGVAFRRLSGRDTLPWPLGHYGDIAAPLLAYGEAYCRQPGSYSIAIRLWSLDGDRIAWERHWQQELAERTPLWFVVPADSIVSGNYELRVAIESGDGAMLAEARRGVIIDNASLLTDQDYQYKIDQLRYLARSRELDSLRKATPATRDSLWAKFWKDRDPTPGTDQNQARDEYYERINYANQHFSIGIKPGWRTDMGQIYIRYGPPDDIERHPFDPDVPAYEIWTYYAINRQFVFSDIQGFGEYRLTYPKTRG